VGFDTDRCDSGYYIRTVQGVDLMSRKGIRGFKTLFSIFLIFLFVFSSISIFFINDNENNDVVVNDNRSTSKDKIYYINGTNSNITVKTRGDYGLTSSYYVILFTPEEDFSGSMIFIDLTNYENDFTSKCSGWSISITNLNKASDTNALSYYTIDGKAKGDLILARMTTYLSSDYSYELIVGESTYSVNFLGSYNLLDYFFVATPEHIAKGIGGTGAVTYDFNSGSVYLNGGYNTLHFVPCPTYEVGSWNGATTAKYFNYFGVNQPHTIIYKNVMSWTAGKSSTQIIQIPYIWRGVFFGVFTDYYFSYLQMQIKYTMNTQGSQLNAQMYKWDGSSWSLDSVSYLFGSGKLESTFTITYQGGDYPKISSASYTLKEIGGSSVTMFSISNQKVGIDEGDDNTGYVRALYMDTSTLTGNFAQKCFGDTEPYIFYKQGGSVHLYSSGIYNFDLSHTRNLQEYTLPDYFSSSTGKVFDVSITQKYMNKFQFKVMKKGMFLPVLDYSILYYNNSGLITSMLFTQDKAKLVVTVSIPEYLLTQHTLLVQVIPSSLYIGVHNTSASPDATYFGYYINPDFINKQNYSLSYIDIDTSKYISYNIDFPGTNKPLTYEKETGIGLFLKDRNYTLSFTVNGMISPDDNESVFYIFVSTPYSDYYLYMVKYTSIENINHVTAYFVPDTSGTYNFIVFATKESDFNYTDVLVETHLHSLFNDTYLAVASGKIHGKFVEEPSAVVKDLRSNVVWSMDFPIDSLLDKLAESNKKIDSILTSDIGYGGKILWKHTDITKDPQEWYGNNLNPEVWDQTYSTSHFLPEKVEYHFPQKFLRL
jgi:hypothetical protein